MLLVSSYPRVSLQDHCCCQMRQELHAVSSRTCRGACRTCVSSMSVSSEYGSTQPTPVIQAKCCTCQLHGAQQCQLLQQSAKTPDDDCPRKNLSDACKMAPASSVLHNRCSQHAGNDCTAPGLMRGRYQSICRAWPSNCHAAACANTYMCFLSNATQLQCWNQVRGQ